MPFLSQLRATPNLLTFLRLFILPFLVIEILDNNYRVAFRSLSSQASRMRSTASRAVAQPKTTLGQYLDPIADKLLLSTLFIVLTYVGLIPRYVTVLVFSRDLGILLIATLLFATGTLRDFRPSLLGKVNTLVQIIGLVSVLLEKLWPIAWLNAFTGGLLQLIAILAPVSAAQYAWIVFRRINSDPAAA